MPLIISTVFPITVLILFGVAALVYLFPNYRS